MINTFLMKPKRNLQYPLKSLVFCGKCGRRLNLQKRVFKCPLGVGTSLECSDIIVNAEELEQLVYEAVCKLIQAVQDKGQRTEDLTETRKSRMPVARRKINMLQMEIEGLKSRKLESYEKYCEGNLSKGEYLELKKKIDMELAQKESELKEEEEKKEDFSPRREWGGSDLEMVCRSFGKMDKLTYESAHAFVEKVIVYAKDRVEIKMKFGDPFGQGNEG